MSTRRNWDRDRERQRVARQGSEAITGSDFSFLFGKRRLAHISKAALRAQAEAAVANFAGPITHCPPGRRNTRGVT